VAGYDAPMNPAPLPSLARDRRVWLSYGLACALAWLMHLLAGLDAQRGSWSPWLAVYQATGALWPPALLGALCIPWMQWLETRGFSATVRLAGHVVAALLFGRLWQALEFAADAFFYGGAHATAVMIQGLLTREIFGIVVYAGLAASFMAVLASRRARAGAIAAAQAEAALARAELAVISGKLKPHFLFNTLNSVIALTRKDPKLAEQALLQFSNMLRYVLATRRDADQRVTLAEELEFVGNYVALEAIRLGPRLQVDWSLDPTTLQDEVPPLSLQPLVENAIVHGVAPRAVGGKVKIASERADGALHLVVQDDGAGCEPQRLDDAPAPGARGGIALAALRRRFALDFEGRARMSIHTAPGQGFRIDLWIPQSA